MTEHSITPLGTRWDVTSVRQDHLQDRLDEGWEPFAVTHPNAVTAVLFHLRRVRT